MRFRATSLAALAAIPLALSACGAAPAPTPEPAPAPPKAAGPEGIEWAGRLCGLVNDFSASQKNLPAVDKSNTQAMKNSVVARLDTALAGIYQRLYDTELHYLSRTEMHSDDKWYVEKYKLYMNLVWLLAEIGGSGGDVMGGVGYRPTNAAVAVFKDRLAEIEVAKKDFDRLMRDVEAFNKTYAGKLGPITDRLSTSPSQ